MHGAVSRRLPCHSMTMLIRCQLYPHIELLLDEEAEPPVQNEEK